MKHHPSRAAIIAAYWLKGYSLPQTARLYRMSDQNMKWCFKRLGILRRERCGGAINAMRLELMLWPGVDEYEEERCRKLTVQNSG